MSFVKTPNLPASKVKFIIIDGRISKTTELNLANMGITPIKTLIHKGLYDSVSFHPDMMLHHIGDNRIVYAPDIDPTLLTQLTCLGFDMIKGMTYLSSSYPNNIAYNAARIGKYVVHNFKYTDPILKKQLESDDLEFIDVKQGYTKCSICILTHTAVITSDKGIEKSLSKNNLDVLLIEPDNNILLPGLDLGFIGGCTGKSDAKTLLINGDLSMLKSCNEIRSFAKKHGVYIKSLSEQNPIDIGSILPIFES